MKNITSISKTLSLPFLLLFLITNPVKIASADNLLNDFEKLPGALSEWIPWIKENNPEWNCAKALDKRACSWVGKVHYNISSQDTTFEIDGLLLNKDSIPLPSKGKLSPSNIRVLKDNKNFESYIIQTSEGNITSIELPKGNYRISGKVLYEKIPSEIPAPAEYGLLDFNIDKSLIDSLNGNIGAYRGKDRIHIQTNSRVEIEDSIRVELFRMLRDGNPLHITTQLGLQVSGNSRTVNFSNILPKGCLTNQINSPLQYSLNEKQELIVQVYQGYHTLDIVCILPQPVLEIDLSEISSELLPEEEIWAWNSYPQFRSVEIEGPRALNPSQVKLPNNLSGNLILGVANKSKVVLKELRRGEEVAPKNSITVTRTIYPKLDKSGFIISDQLNGVLNSESRINILPEYSLGGATLSGSLVPITLDPKTGESGVEIRGANFALSGTSKIDKPFFFKTAFSSTGWNSEMEQVNFILPLPPSWKLLAIGNVSSASGTWVSLWNSYDVFLLLILAIMTAKLFNKKVSALFVIFSVLSKGEFMNPGVFFSWLLVFYAASTALNSTAHQTLKGAIYGSVFLSLAAYFVQTLSFAKLQFIQFLHPQLQSGTRYRSLFQSIASFIDSNPVFWPAILVLFFIALCFLLWALKGENWGQKIGRIIVGGICFIVISFIGGGILTSASLFMGTNPTYFGDNLSRSNTFDQEIMAGAPSSYYSEESAPHETYDDIAISKVFRSQQKQKPRDRELQSGLSTPEWKWRGARAVINGPIDPGHEIYFLYLTSSIEKYLCGFRALLSLFLLFFTASFVIPVEKLKKIAPLKATSAIIFFLLSPLFNITDAKAEFPPEFILKNLEKTLESRLCAKPICSTIDSLTLETTDTRYSIKISANSVGKSTITLPGQITDLIPEKILVNGSEKSYSRINNGHLEIMLSDGTSEVEVQGSLKPNNTINITFPQTPLSFDYNSSEWKSDKLIQRGEIPTEIKLVRETKATAGVTNPTNPRLGKEDFPETFIIKRTIEIGEYVEIRGSVSRLGHTEKAATLEIPLHKNEILTSPELKSSSGRIIINFPAGTRDAQFSSRFDSPRELSLSAYSGTGAFETWHITCEDYVACEARGLPITRGSSTTSSKLDFLPFQGETLSVTSRLLESAPGAYLTIERVNHQNTWGENRLNGNLEIYAKATRQTSLNISISDQVEITSIQVGGNQDTRKLNPENISVLLEPGDQTVLLQYVRPFSPSLFETVPEITLNSPVTNIRTSVSLQAYGYRWLMYFGGGEWGPASLFWSKLLVIIIFLFALRYLGILSINPIKLFGFGVGLSMIPTILQGVPLLGLILFNNKDILNLIEEKTSSKVFKTGISIILVSCLLVFYYIIRIGLLSEPTSLIAGNNSNLTILNWYHDASSFSGLNHTLPAPWIMSLPIIYWRVITHAVAILMVFIGLKWIKNWISLLKK
ncbi:MAG TPA: hypothetical protein PKA63_13430 [Oligoflexia bacterium]|nr:hypothetical protein [Oligoflexia bacterium]HMP49663.1 hypothetical protein [Oligoflexia bacterium]